MKICFNLISVFCSLNDNLSSMYLEEDQIKDDIINTTLVDYYESFSKFSKAVEVDHKKTGFENQHTLYLNNDKADSDVYNCYLDTGDEELVRTKNKELKEFESYIFEECNFKNKEPNRNKKECLSFVEIQNNHIFEVMDHEDVNFSNSDDINLSIDQPELNIDLNAEDYLVQVNPLVKTSLCNFSNVQFSNIPECDVDLNKTKYIDIYNDIDDISKENHSNSDSFYNYTTYTDEMSQLDTNTISRLVDNIESFESETFKEQNILNFTLTTQEPANQELSRTRKFTNIAKLHSLVQENRLIDLDDKTYPFLEFYKDLLPENETYNLDQYTSLIPSEYGIVDLEKDCKNTNAFNSFTTYCGIPTR